MWIRACYQHPITCVQTLSVRFPALCPLLHNRPIERKVHASELNVVDETVAVHSFGKEKTKTVTKERWWIFIISASHKCRRISK